MSGAVEEERQQVPPLPDGARDVLPVEAAELAVIERRLRDAYARFGYREVRTPLLEFAEVMDAAQDGGLGRAFRLFDDHGDVLVVRPDLTIPVARLVAGRLADHPGPVRVSYVAETLRPSRAGRAQRLEERQAGLELVGLSDPSADAEIVAILVASLRELGLTDLRVALGDVSLTRAVLGGVGVGESDQERLRDAVRNRNLVAWRRAAEALPLDAASRAVVTGLPMRRGGPEVLERIAAAVPAAAPSCAAFLRTLELLRSHGAEDAVIVDLGVLRDWGYYSGIVVEAYAPGVGRPVALGGRYDGLIGRFGAARPAVGATVLVERVHEAMAARDGHEDIGDGVVLSGGLDGEIGAAASLRAEGIPVIAVPAGDSAAGELAAVDGWRFVARRSGRGFAVTDRSTGTSIECDDLREGVRSLRS